MERQVDHETYRCLVGSAAKLLQPYFIGFVKLHADNGELDASSAGSGTLVSIGNARGVLTAGHVIRSMMEQEVVGIAVPSGTLAPIKFRTEYCRSIVLFEEKDEYVGPDLGFLLLPPNTTSALGALMSFYNLTKHAERMLEKPPPLKDGFWGITGFAEEFTTDDETPPKGFLKGKIFRGAFGAGVVVAEEEREGFDYLKYEALYNEHYEGPESFGGFSGGGLWQLLVALKEEKLEIRERLLVGVAYYETERHQTADGLVRHLSCHGRKSVYQIMLEKIQTEMKTE